MPSWTREDLRAKSQSRTNALSAGFPNIVPTDQEPCFRRKPDGPAAQVAGRLFVRLNPEKQLWNVIEAKARNEAGIR